MNPCEHSDAVVQPMDSDFVRPRPALVVRMQLLYARLRGFTPEDCTSRRLPFVSREDVAVAYCDQCHRAFLTNNTRCVPKTKENLENRTLCFGCLREIAQRAHKPLVKSSGTPRIPPGAKTPAPDDWRRQGQHKFLTGVVMIRTAWEQYGPDWDHDHCDFCWAKFSIHDDDLKYGWTTEDQYHWVCDECYNDFKYEFGWVVAEES